MIKNGKFYVPPEQCEGNFKDIFRKLVTAGAGRSVDKDGFPSGPWTPERLAAAITRIDANRSSIELRTVQLWFQLNDKGVSPDNIRWLARIFGCNDPDATSAWQAKLSASLIRLAAERRRRSKSASHESGGFHPETDTPTSSGIIESSSSADVAPARDGGTWRTSLALRSEEIFSRGSPLDLPSAVFAGAAALGFLSYLSGIHSATYERADGVVKQVGFIWAPNWTLLFMVLMPVYFACVVDLLVFWTRGGREKLQTPFDEKIGKATWRQQIEVSYLTYWVVFIFCLVFAGLLQWIDVRLIPLIAGRSEFAIDWGSVALVRPDIVSIPLSIGFTGIAYLYMSICFYLFFVGLILLFTIAYDLASLSWAARAKASETGALEANDAVQKILYGIFRCTVLGLLIAICMKLQSYYLTSSSQNIATWLSNDIVSVLHGRKSSDLPFDYNMPTHYSSLLVALSTFVVFAFGWARTVGTSPSHFHSRKMLVAMGLLVIGYLMIGLFDGFSILLVVGVLFATYGLFDPTFGSRGSTAAEEDLNVL